MAMTLGVRESDRASDLGWATRTVLDGVVKPAFQVALLSSQGYAVTVQLVGAKEPSGKPDAVYYLERHRTYWSGWRSGRPCPARRGRGSCSPSEPTRRADRSLPTIAVVRHHAHSMAATVCVSCDYAMMMPMASMTIHEAQGGRDDHLAILRTKLLDIYEARTLANRQTLAGYLAGGVTLDPYVAHSHGFCDEVAGPERLEEIAYAAASTAGLYAHPITRANSWRRRVLRERQADAEGVTRLGPAKP